MLGERMCGCVVLRQGASLTLEELTDFLAEAGIARFELPERLEALAELPHDAGGQGLEAGPLRAGHGSDGEPGARARVRRGP